MIKKTKRKNPFAGYQKQRKEETVTLVKGAIKRIKEHKGTVTYANVAGLASRTEAGIRANKEAALLIEQAIAGQRGSAVPMLDSSHTMPTTLDDCHAMLRIQRSEMKELKKVVSTYRALIKRYNLSSDGNIAPADMQEIDGYRAALKIIMAIIDDKIYRLTNDGIESVAGKKIVSRRLCDVAGLTTTTEEF